MKVKPEHYAHPLTTIKNANLPIQAHREALKTDLRVKDLEKRLRWDLFWAVRKTLGSDWVDTLFSYCDNDRVDTALKHIMAEISTNAPV